MTDIDLTDPLSYSIVLWFCGIHGYRQWPPNSTHRTTFPFGLEWLDPA